MAALLESWGAPIAAVIALVGAWLASRRGRVSKLERRIDGLERRERLLWLHHRHVVDMYYRYRADDAPDLPVMPAGVFADETE